MHETTVLQQVLHLLRIVTTMFLVVDQYSHDLFKPLIKGYLPGFCLLYFCTLFEKIIECQKKQVYNKYSSFDYVIGDWFTGFINKSYSRESFTLTAFKHTLYFPLNINSTDHFYMNKLQQCLLCTTNSSSCSASPSTYPTATSVCKCVLQRDGASRTRPASDTWSCSSS